MAQPAADATFDVRELRKILGCFATGVAIVTTIDEDDNPRGLTVNSFTSVSLDPPLVLFCVAKGAPMCRVLLQAPTFAINILAKPQQDLSTRFATPIADKFAGLAWNPGQTGSPVFPDILAHLDCRRHGLVEAGDHVVLLGEVVDCARHTNEPLIFNQGGYAALAKSELERTNA